MNYKERLEKMLASGVITTDQAKELQDNIDRVSLPAEAPAHKNMPAGLIAGGAGAFAVALIMVLFLSSGNGGQEMRLIQDVSASLNQPRATGGMEGPASSFISLVILSLPLIAAFAGYAPFIHNRFVALEEEMLASWAHVESSYQKRADLLPNLAEAVRRYMDLEQGVQGDVTQARAEGDKNDLAAALEQLESAAKIDESADITAMTLMDKAAGKVIAVMENYPDLKAAENISLLQHQLEDIESRINAARIFYNEAVRDYNRAIGKAPGNLVAAMGGFEPRPYFESMVAAGMAETIDLTA